MQTNPKINELKRKKESNSVSSFAKPPPTLPKPKFILPQSSTTNMILQRNLKAKSELNIATTPSTFSSSSAASTSSTSSQEHDNHHNHHLNHHHHHDSITKQTNSCNSKKINHNQQQQQQQQQQQKQPAIKNKFLENSSIVSTSQGYHSDTWESQSSRQSFETEKPAQGIAKC